VSRGGPKWQTGFKGVTTIVKYARYDDNRFGEQCPVRLDKWHAGKSGRYVITAHPLNDEDKRDVTREIWIATHSAHHTPADFGDRYEPPDISPQIDYKWVYDAFMGFPRGLDNILFFDGADNMKILYDGGVTDISGRPLQRVVDDFHRQFDPYRFKLAVATENHLHELETAISGSSLGLTAQNLPRDFIRGAHSGDSFLL